jgi:hypothetical protein
MLTYSNRDGLLKCVIHRHPFNKIVGYGKTNQNALGWVRLHLQKGNAGLTCLWLGISRPTLRL